MTPTNPTGTPARATWEEVRAQHLQDLRDGTRRISAFLLSSRMRASAGWAAVSHEYSPSLNYDRTWIFGSTVLTSPNPFR